VKLEKYPYNREDPVSTYEQQNKLHSFILAYTMHMQAFIITGGSDDSRTKYVADLNTTGTELIHLFAEKSSLTIKQVQDLNGPLSIAARLPRIIWIEEANLLTVPAQNALLKMLEEPPENTDFYLTCASATSLLPTIRSRAKLIGLENKDQASDPAILADIKSVMGMTAGDRLTSILKRDRSESIVWIEQIEASLRDKLREKNISPGSAQMLAKIAGLAQKAHGEYLANCSVSLVTQNFYLTLPHTHSAK
jgi:DNA polymerase III delta prime subunit